MGLGQSVVLCRSLVGTQLTALFDNCKIHVVARTNQRSKDKRQFIITWRNEGQSVVKIEKTLNVSNRYSRKNHQALLNQHGYNSILQQHANPSGLCLVGPSFIFQQDNDPKHTSRLCKSYLTKKESDGVLRQMTWPPQSPDHFRWWPHEAHCENAKIKAVIRAKGGYFEESK